MENKFQEGQRIRIRRSGQIAKIQSVSINPNSIFERVRYYLYESPYTYFLEDMFEEIVIENSDDARKYFEDLKLSYTMITRESLEELNRLISIELTTHDDEKVDYKMLPFEKANIDFYRNRLNHCYLKFSSNYFESREAISFNPDGFIGFNGEGSSRNKMPFVRAFIQWCNQLADIHFSINLEPVNELHFYTLAVNSIGTHKMRFSQLMTFNQAESLGKIECKKMKLGYIGTFDEWEIDNAEKVYREQHNL